MASVADEESATLDPPSSVAEEPASLGGEAAPFEAPHAAAGARFLAFLLGPEGRAILGAHAVDALRQPEFIGDSVPATLRQARR